MPMACFPLGFFLPWPSNSAILALLFLGGLVAACDSDHRIFTNKSDCMNAAPSYHQDCEEGHVD